MREIHFKQIFFAIAILLLIVSTGLTLHKDNLDAKLNSNAALTIDTSKMHTTDSAVEKKQSIKTPKVIAYYFHSTRRCVSCKKIERYSKEAIMDGFKKELENGTLEFYSINIDKPENRHFVKDYKLYTKSLIICHLVDGKQKEWENLTEIWKLLRKKDKFLKYVQDGINVYLKEN